MQITSITPTLQSDIADELALRTTSTVHNLSRLSSIFGRHLRSLNCAKFVVTIIIPQLDHVWKERCQYIVMTSS